MKRSTILTFFASTLFLIVPLGSSIGNSPSQRGENKKCPTVEVKGPRRSKGPKAIKYRARIKNLPSGARRILNWSIEGAEILTGQGTDVIKVQPFGGEVRATVMVENIHSECQSTQASMVTELTYFVGCSLPPIIRAVELSPSSIVRPCSEGRRSETCSATGNLVEVTADAPEAPQDELLFTWSVTAGRLIGEGRKVSWDLSGVPKGTYTVTVEVNDGNQLTANASTTLTVSDCTECKPSN